MGQDGATLGRAAARVISTFGVIFASNQGQVAAELARICRPGGRLVLASWPPNGAVAEFFGLIARHSGARAASRRFAVGVG